ncbi:MAG: hypothetical protein HY237_05390 [Acidobacteria bacterium]|nr:hypothetical protein [Acidobacteriota bacterium]
MAHRFTIGVEEKHQIVDPSTGELRSHGSELIAATPPGMGEQIKPELHESIVEMGTRISENVEELRGELHPQDFGGGHQRGAAVARVPGDQRLPGCGTACSGRNARRSRYAGFDRRRRELKVGRTSRADPGSKITQGEKAHENWIAVRARTQFSSSVYRAGE